MERASGRDRNEGVAAPPVRPDGLQLAEDRPFQEFWWNAERIAQAVFVALALSALGGLAGGGGAVSRLRIETGAGVVDLPRVARWEAADHVEVIFASGAPAHRLTLSGDFATRFDVMAVQPRPARSWATADALTFAFEPGESPAGGSAPLRATLRISPQSPGLARIGLRLDDGPAAEAAVLVLP